MFKLQSLFKHLIANWAFLLTCGWLGYVIGRISENHDQFLGLSLNEFGDFVAGSVGPLALFWLVNGYFQQNRAISIQSNELCAQVAATQNLVDNELRQARIDYYKRVSLCAKKLSQCKLALWGDTSTAQAIRASSPFLLPYESLATQLKTISLGITGKSAVEILKEAFTGLQEKQDLFEKELLDLRSQTFEAFEKRLLDLVRHEVDIETLEARINLQEKRREVQRPNRNDDGNTKDTDLVE